MKYMLQEAEAFTLYGKALDLLRQGDSDKAEDVFQDLIQQDFLIEVSHFMISDLCLSQGFHWLLKLKGHFDHY